MFFLILISGCGQGSERGSSRQVAKEKNLLQEREVTLSQENVTSFAEGDNLDFDVTGNLIRHTWVKEGRPIYQATYRNQQKISNKLFPQIQDSFLFEDKYYLKIYFPFPYRGKIGIELENDPEYVLTPVEDQLYQVVINHALDLNRVDFLFHYQPAATDTLVETTFPYSFVIMDDGQL